MTHLILNQQSGISEQVSSTCIDDLYILSQSNTLDSSSSLTGKINADTTSKEKVNALHTLDSSDQPVAASDNEGRWDNLFITSTAYAFVFADPLVKQLLVQNTYNGKDPTEQDIALTSSHWSTNPYHTDAYPYVMPYAAFANTQIQTFDELRYFSSIASIGNQLFENCTNLRSITMPPPVSGYKYEIGWIAFKNCNNLQTLTLPFGQIVELNGQSGLPGTVQIYVPAAMVEDYKAATNWSNYANNIHAIE